MKAVKYEISFWNWENIFTPLQKILHFASRDAWVFDPYQKRVHGNRLWLWYIMIYRTDDGKDEWNEILSSINFKIRHLIHKDHQRHTVKRHLILILSMEYRMRDVFIYEFYDSENCYGLVRQVSEFIAVRVGA